MKFIGVSQRVVFISEYQERRDCIDQQWIRFLYECGFISILLPNHISSTTSMLENIKLSGILLTGGNSLIKYGGDAPERDETERYCIEFAIRKSLPVMGICRGMQVIQDFFGLNLEKVAGHVNQNHVLKFAGSNCEVNSYHHYGAFNTTRDLEITATASDGVVEAIRHKEYLIAGMMWHPERFLPFSERDVEMFKNFF
jgi:N5-(cytidine 5'-diphosphoramidyl)-L-glutamine hydrolase